MVKCTCGRDYNAALLAACPACKTPSRAAGPWRDVKTATPTRARAVVAVAVIVVAGIAFWGMTQVGKDVAPGNSGAAAVDKYTNNWAGLDAAIADCARQWITADQFPATGDLMQDAQLLDNAIYAVGTCVTEKNPEYVCETPEGMTTVCAYSDKSTTGRMIQNADSVDSRLRAVGAPGY
ncbi:unannotated protein [freshwater metagenome]|uniref:Unannotated protein n=1 Tax=freshwater metagenome TaxID=449393 RepID=A0A6J7M236_9ZZZZ